MTVFMRWPTFLLALMVCILCSSACQAQLIDMIQVSGEGPNFGGIFVNNTSSGTYLTFGGYEWSVSVYSPSNPPNGATFGSVGIGSYWGISTGPLIAHTDSSWIFGGVGIDNSAGGPPQPLTVPYGYSTCASAGLMAGPDGTGYCLVYAPLTGGGGPAVFNLLGSPVDGYQYYSFTSPFVFSTNPQLGAALGVPEGPYYGWLTISGSARTDFMDVPEGFPAGSVATVNLIGSTVPEPSSVVLLLTLLGGLAISFRMRWWSNFRRCAAS